MWLKEDTFMARYDYSANELRSKIQRKVWIKGQHYAIIDGRRRFNEEVIEEWTTQQALDQKETPLKYVGSSRVSDTVKPLQKRPTKPTSRMQLA